MKIVIICSYFIGCEGPKMKNKWGACEKKPHTQLWIYDWVIDHDCTDQVLWYEPPIYICSSFTAILKMHLHTQLHSQFDGIN